LNANPETGEVSIYHLSAHLDPVDITSYSIISANGSLQPDAWTSLSDGGDAAWTEANPQATGITELNLTGSTILSNGTVISLGNIFDTAGTRDLMLQYTAADMLFDATVEYGEVPDGGGPGPGLPGDIDGDGTVGFPDFLILSANFGAPADPVGCCGDIDGDGSVGFPDFLILSANFGQSGGASAAAVPEPNSAALLGIGGAVLLGLRRRRRSTGTAMSAGLR
jgi:hypothetical protein